MSNLIGRGVAARFLFLAVGTTAAFGARWIEADTGITGSFPIARALVIHKTGSSLYALTSGNNIFRSTDGGSTWKLLGGISGVIALATDPTDPSTVYAAANAVFKSTDGGDTWQSAGLAGVGVTLLAVDPVAPATIYAAAVGGHIYKSTDGAASWNAFPIPLPSAPIAAVATLVVDPQTPSTLYAIARVAPSALYKSTDGGESWSMVNPGPFTSLLVIDPSTPATLYGIRFGDGLSKSTDGGVTWTPTGFTAAVIALAVDPTNSRILYATTSGPNQTAPAIYKSIDGGQNWAAVNTTIPVAGSLVVNAANPSEVYAATFNGGVFKSIDAGANWKDVNSGLRVLNIRTLAADPADPATVYAGGDEGLFKTADAGASWRQAATFQVTCCAPPPGLPPGLPPPPSAIPPFPAVAPASVYSLLIDFTNPNILYASTHRPNGCFFADILLYKSMDAGANWDNSITPHDSGCITDALLAMDPADPNTLYLRSGDFLDGYGLEKSTDGGASWAYAGLGADTLGPLVIDPADPAKLYAGTDNGVVRSTDGGANWSPAGLLKTNVSLLAIDALHPTVLYAGASAGLYKSTDSGANWSPVNDGLGDLLNGRAPLNALIADPRHPGALYLATSGYGVFKSSDGGVTWIAYNDGLPYLEVRALTLVPGDNPILYAGTPGGVFKLAE